MPKRPFTAMYGHARNTACQALGKYCGGDDGDTKKPAVVAALARCHNRQDQYRSCDDPARPGRQFTLHLHLQPPAYLSLRVAGRSTANPIQTSCAGATDTAPSWRGGRGGRMRRRCRGRRRGPATDRALAHRRARAGRPCHDCQTPAGFPRRSRGLTGRGQCGSAEFVGEDTMRPSCSCNDPRGVRSDDHSKDRQTASR